MNERKDEEQQGSRDMDSFSSKTEEIVIVGGGISGLATALALHRYHTIIPFFYVLDSKVTATGLLISFLLLSNTCAREYSTLGEFMSFLITIFVCVSQSSHRIELILLDDYDFNFLWR